MNNFIRNNTRNLISPAESVTMSWVGGLVNHPVGKVLQIKTQWSRQDYLGQIKARISSFRMRYKIPPGLYAVGNPTESSQVFVTANYKLSFDKLRQELHGIDAWVLVLDTKGINVWCAAGKSTFGTVELVNKIRQVGLDKIVSHRRIIVPQLGAPGIHAHIVKKATGFTVLFGPVYTRDIKAYLQTGFKATEEMRTVRFSFLDRLILTPMEVIPAFKKFWIFILALFILFGLQPGGILFRESWFQGLPFLLMGVFSILIGAILTPLLLPFIPFRSFALKGWLTGSVVFAALFPIFNRWLDQDISLLTAAYLFFPAVSSYLALNFTGSTSFTNMSGVKKELKIAIPLYIAATLASLVFIVFNKLKYWEIL